MPRVPDARAGRSGGLVLLTLATAQFLMTLDSSVMNVSIATVAKDVGTTVTGIQLAITLYTLVMAAFMITGGKIGQIIGRRRAFMIGCVVYGCGSFITALAHSLPLLIIGWSVLEGLGATLIMPSVVALVATNFGASERPRAYGLIASASAIAVAAGPLIGGLCTTYLTWRVVFAGEVVLVLVILALSTRIADAPRQADVHLDPVGTLLSAAGLGLVVFGVIRTGTWGFVLPKPDAPHWLGTSPVVWLMLGGGAVLVLFVLWESRRVRLHKGALVDPRMLRVPGLQAGLTSFFFQYLLQAGLFFVIPLFLSVALGLSAVATGVRLLPLSIALLVAAVGVPKLFPKASPRRVVRIGFGLLFVAIVILVAVLDAGSGPEVRHVAAPAGRLRRRRPGVTTGQRDRLLGPRLCRVARSVASRTRSPTWAHPSGTALAGTVLIAVLTTTFLGTVASDPAVPAAMASKAQVELSAGIPFVSDNDLSSALAKANVPTETADAIVADNASARINGLRASLAILALLALVGLALTRRLPTVQPADLPTPVPAAAGPLPNGASNG